MSGIVQAKGARTLTSTAVDANTEALDVAVKAGDINLTEDVLTTANESAATVSTSAVQILASNTNRKGFIITNNGTGNLFLGHTSGVTSSGASMGLKVVPGGTASNVSGQIFTGDIYGIYDEAAASQNVATVEYEA